jgi:hypothetical protein
MLVNFITIINGLFYGDLVAKLFWFGIDGIIIFQRLKTRMTMEPLEQHAPFLTNIHYMAHKCNLAMQSFRSFPLVVKIEGLLYDMYVFFSYFPNRKFEHAKLVKNCKQKD